MSHAGIRIGVGGWTYAPWRNNFFPPGLAHTGELAYASRHLTSIEINGTYYRTQSASSFAKWRDATPDDFLFSVKASRYATNQRVLADAGESIERFINSGVAELGEKLGPIVWQFATTKQFAADDFSAFLKMLPAAVDGVPLRHAMDVRHDSFMCAEYLALARRHGVATVFADSDAYPSFADLTAGFVYARLMRTAADVPTGYQPDAIVRWAEAAATWAAGGYPADLPMVEPQPAAPSPRASPQNPRDVFIYFISGAKERAPAAAMALIERVKAS